MRQLTLTLDRDRFVTTPPTELHYLPQTLGWSRVPNTRSLRADAEFGVLLSLSRQAKADGVQITYEGDGTLEKVDELRKTYMNYIDAHKWKVMPEDELDDHFYESGIPGLMPTVESFRPYQRRCLLWLIQVRRGAALLEMGLGKTLLAIAYIKKLIDLNEAKKVLLVAPIALLSETAWFGELQRHTDFRVVDLRKKNKYDPDPGAQHIHVVNPELISARCFTRTKKSERSYIPDNFIASERFDTIVFDESSLLGNPGSLLTTAMLRIMRPTPNVLWLSGAQSPNRIFQLWPMARAFGAMLYPSNTAFLQKYGYPKMFGPAKVYYPRPFANEEIRRIVDPITFYVEREGNVDLPPRTCIDVHVEMTPDQRALYDRLENDYIATINGLDPQGNPIESTVAIKQEFVLRMKLLQLTSGFVLHKNSYDETKLIELPYNPKLEKLMELLALDHDEGVNAIIWCYFRKEVETIHKAIAGKWGHESVAYYYGSMSDKDREEQLHKWKNTDACRFICANPKAARFGHNWTRATKTYYFSTSSDFADYTQSRDRCYRIGQTKPVYEIKLKVKDSVDSIAWEALSQRTKLDKFLKTYFLGQKPNFLC